jgi:serine/threonine protein kinase
MLVRSNFFQKKIIHVILALPAYPLHTSSSVLLTNRQTQSTIIYVNGIPYTVLRLLGEGLHSRVYAAYDPRTGQSVAIKIVENLDSFDNHQHSKMFFKEIRYLTKLQPRNPYVIRVYNHEFDSQSQTGKIVMETGHDFRFMLPLQASANEKKMTNAQAKYYWYQMVEAVALLHRHGIVHSG